ncbi:MAG: PQQ-binding-like beta-propeller repeat protein, partial [Alphaproteobacteria bacterium]
TMKVYDPTKWTYWGGDAGQTRYAPLNDINLQTVGRLKIAWRWTAEPSGGALSNNFKATPLLDDGVLYVPWLNHGMAAIDAGTGKTIWTFEPQPASIGGGAGTLAPRSLAYWTDGKEKRLYHNSLDGRLIAVDAKTGRYATEFGHGGWINLQDDLRPERKVRSAVRSVSPALVVGDVVIAQIITANGRNKEVMPGDVRGYDVRSGKLLWTFHVIPRPGEFGYETWENGSAETAGQGGIWSMMSGDPDLHMVYLPMEDASNDFAGVDRPGDNLFTDGIVALDSRTGRRVWHFQVMHHGILDYDSPSAPVLHDIVQNGKRIPVVTLLTKQGFIFTFDRRTGHPVWPIEERPVPQGNVPGEKYSKTQPFPTRPAPFAPQGYDENQLIDFTPALRAQAIEIMKSYAKGPLYTPPALVTAQIKGTLVYPGFGGGANWNGAAFDPETGKLYIPTRNRPSAVGVIKGNPANTDNTYVETNNTTLMGPQGLPIFKPPYSELVAYDMNKGDKLWHIADGGAPDNVRNSPLLQGLGLDFEHMGQFDIRPGPLLTKELLFMGESGTISASRGGSLFRVYDKRDGKQVGTVQLPTLSTGAPMTYMHKGRQYIIVPVSAPGKPAELVAMTLDGASDNGPLPSSGPTIIQAPPSVAAAAASIAATSAELAQGAAAYARVCAGCHAPDGKGATGPALTGRTDFANIVRVINGGQGEMPTQAPKMTPAEIDAVAKHVVKTLNPQPA